MRIGTGLAEPGGLNALDGLADQLRVAADDGFSSAWLSNIFGLEALTALAVAGRQIPGIELGTAVVPSFPRHPAVLAQQALTADLALGGRLTLGVGLSHQIVIQDMYGYSFERPARHMREFLAILLPLLAGDPVGFDGATLHAHIGLSVPRSPRRVPVLLAALAPRMLRLAGELADGTVLWMTGPATVRDYIVPSITAAASAAGRPSPRVVCMLPVCVTDDPARARADADQAMAIYGQLPSYRAMLDKEGAAGP
jgi:5,10-methylenetetrahydromethanopterin reductase